MAFLKSLSAMLFLFAFNTSGVLLDKIVAVVNDTTYTLSQVQRVKENLEARKQISPFIYKKTMTGETKQLLTQMIHRPLIRDYLKDQGLIVNDTQVERQIQDTETRLALQRHALLTFLKKNNMSFEEYFELIRESIEFNLFQERVMRPLVSVSDQEVKNEYYKKNKGLKTLSFNLHLIDFSLSKRVLSSKDLAVFPSVLKTFQKTGNLPEKFSKVQVKDLGEIKEDGLNASLRKTVKNLNESEFSTPLLIADEYHVFFVKKKNLTESDDFLTAKNTLKTELFLKKLDNVQSLWFEREISKHHVKYFL